MQEALKTQFDAEYAAAGDIQVGSYECGRVNHCFFKVLTGGSLADVVRQPHR